MAKRMFNVPISLVSLVDGNRQWFKSCTGLDVLETPRDISFCGHAILGEDIFCVPDTKKDKRFVDNPLVTGEPHITRLGYTRKMEQSKAVIYRIKKALKKRSQKKHWGYELEFSHGIVEFEHGRHENIDDLLVEGDTDVSTQIRRFEFFRKRSECDSVLPIALLQARVPRQRRENRRMLWQTE
ncbi:MAG: hypothetical protein ACJAUG_000633 [Halioglobus sp.]|jgi:hypothetical protein